MSHKILSCFNSSITVFETFIIIVKCRILEIANDLKVFILPSEYSFLIRYSLIALQVFNSFTKIQVICNFHVIRFLHFQYFYTFFNQVDIFYTIECHIYIFQKTFAFRFDKFDISLRPVRAQSRKVRKWLNATKILYWMLP